MSAELDALDRWFPGAERGYDFTQRQLERIRAAGGRPQSTIWAASTCSDDLMAGATQLGAKLAGPFWLGGLAGLPHAGRTGMTAFAHHIPDGGTAFVFYGPHVGIDEDGQPGYVRRPGQARASTCCGALMLALSRQNASQPPGEAPDDQQLAALERLLAPYATKIRKAQQPVLAAVDVLYDAIHAQVTALLEASRPEFHGVRIVTCGAITIHLSPGEDARLLVRHEDVLRT